MIHTRTLQASITANLTEAIGEIIAPKGEIWTVLEIGYFFTGVGSIQGFLRERQIDTVNSILAPTKDNRVVKGDVMEAGHKYSFSGSDTSGAANLMGVVLVVEEIILTGS